MKQVLQNQKTGDVKATDVPAPVARSGFVLVRTEASLISAGTERATVEAGQKSLLARAVEQPHLVSQVIQRAKSEGILNTVEAVRSKLSSLLALGYSAAGTVIEVGNDVSNFHVGDRVACAGVGYASHAEVLSVPKNLCVRLPIEVSFDAAAFSTFGADGGCAPDDDARRRVMEWSRGRGADAVLITAATSSNAPVELAGEISRQKGRVVAVGAVGLNIPRQPFYDRELTFKISMSYGPGRYDPEYEERGHDYPIGYVRWTEGRNLETFLDLLAEGRVNVEGLITHRFPLAQAEKAYQLIAGESGEPYLGVVLHYESAHDPEKRIPIAERKAAPATPARSVRVGLIGAGNYARAMLLPHFKSAGAELQSIATASGVTARTVAEKFGFRYCVSGADEVLADEEVNLIVIATRHDTHAELARRALSCGRHVFVEKPLALNDDELESVIAAAAQSKGELIVGYNRRFSPLARAAKTFFTDRQAPLSINYRVNAGRIPSSHWAQDAREGGGRIIGEVCHFIDFMHFMTGSLTTRVYAESIVSRDQEITNEDSVFITLRFADGSNGSIAYVAEGDKALPKERIEIFGAGKSFVIDNFRSCIAYQDGREKKTKLRAQDKGQEAEVSAVCAVVLEGRPAPIALDDLATATRATFRIRDSLRTSLPVEV